MIDYFNQIMHECVQIIESHIIGGNPDTELRAVLEGAGYVSPTTENYHYDDILYNAVYFIRYGYAYAYEYSVLYQIMLDDYRDEIYGVTTFGCGSCIDAWSLAYANSRLRKPVSLRYMGIDLEKWKIKFEPLAGSVLERAYDGNMYYPNDNVFQKDIIDFFSKESWHYYYNTVFFSKILNELDSTKLDDLIRQIQEKAVKFEKDRNHYICISHSRKAYKDISAMKKIAKRICDAINFDGRFIINDSLPGIWGGLPRGLKMVDVSDPDDYACYEFPKDSPGYDFKIEELNEDFSPTEEVESIRSIISPFLGHQCVRRTSTSLIQIIKLSPQNA